MSIKQAVTQGKEHLILLPSEDITLSLPNTPPKVVTRTGMHAIVLSGYAIRELDGTPQPEGVYLPMDPPFSTSTNDDDVVEWTWQVTVGPEWRNVIQVSPSVTAAGIASGDSDDVDHSRWVVRSCTWDTHQTLAGERIRLTFKTEVQGGGNGLINFAYQLTATGDLWGMPDFDQVSADFP